MNRKSLTFRSRVVAAALAFAACWACPASAAIYTWDISGNGSFTDGSGTWDTTTTNWNGVSPTVVWPNSSTAIAAFSGATGGTVTLGTSLAAGGITIGGAHSYLFNGTGSPTLTLDSGGITVASGATAQTFDTTLALALSSSQSWTNNSGNLLTINSAIANGANLLTVAGNGNTSFGGVIGNGGGGLTKTGSGTLTLSAANTYTGPTTLSGGALTLQFNATNNALGVINSGNALTLGSSTTLNALGGSTAIVDAQTFGSTALSGGLATIALTKNTATSVTVNLGTLTLSAASYLNLTVPASTVVTASHALDASGVLLGPWATVGTGTSLQYAADSNATNGSLTSYAGATAATATTLGNVTSATTNYSYATAGVSTVGGPLTGNTLRYTVGAGTLALGNNTLTLNGLMNAGTAKLTINANDGVGAGLVTGANSELDIVTNTQSVTINAPISGAGAVVYGGPSAGTFTISDSTSSYTGKTSVLNGTFVYTVPLSLAGVNGPLGAPTGANATIDLYPGTTFQYNSPNQISQTTDRTINLAGAGPGTVSLNGVNVNDTNFYFNGPITATGTGPRTLQIKSQGDRPFYRYAGGIPNMSDGSPVTVSGIWGSGSSTSNGIIDLTGVNTFSGPLNLTGGGNGGPGTLLIGGSGNTAGNILTVAPGGTGVLGSGNYAGNITFASGTVASVQLYYASGANQTFSGVISGPGALTMGGTNSSLTLTNTNTFSLATTVAGGTLTLGNRLAIENSPLNSAISGGSLDLTTNNITTPVFGGLTGSTKLSSTSTLGYGNVTNLTLNPVSGATVSYAGVIADGAAGMNVTKTGAGTQILSGSDTYTGTTTISAGALQANDGMGLPSGSFLSLDGGVLQSSGALTFTRGLAAGGASKFQFTANGGGFSATGTQFTVNIGNASALQTWGSTPGTNIVGTLQFGSSAASGKTVLQNPIDLNAATRTVNVTAGTGGDSAEMSGVIQNSSGLAGLTETGNGTLMLSAANTYNGVTTLSGGALNLGTTENPGTSGPLGNPATPTGSIVFNGGTLQFSNSNQYDYSARLTTSGNNPYSIDSNGQSVTFASGLPASGSSGLTKLGFGTLTLSGSNLYSGTTTVSAGLLVLSGSNGSASGPTTVSANATLRAGAGYDFPTGTLTLAGSNSTLDLRADTATNFAKNLTVSANSIINVDDSVGGVVTPGTHTLGNLSIGAQILNVTGADGYSLALGAASLTGAATLNALSANMTVASINGTQNLTLDGTTAGNTVLGAITIATGTLTKNGPGTWTLAGSSNYSGATTVNGGTLKLDMNQGGSQLSTNAPTLADGTLAVSGSNGVASAQTLGNATFKFGSGISVTGGASGTLNLTVGNTWTRNLGSTVNITLSSGTLTSSPAVDSSTPTPLVKGSGNIAFATVGGTDWAKVSGGQVVAFAPGDYNNSFLGAGDSGTLNYSQTDNASVTASDTVNTLKINTTQASQSLAITGGQVLTFSAGGLLFVGANDYSITGGSLKGSGGTQKELVVQQYGGGNLTIGSVIADNGAATSLVKAGPGALTLTNAGNFFTGGAYLNGGTLNIGAAGVLGASTGENTSVTAGLQGSLYLNNGSTVVNTSGSALDLSANKINMVWNGSITFVGAADGSKNLYFSPAGITANNNSAVVLLNNSIVNVTAGTVNVGTHLSGAFSVTKNGTGELQVGNGNNNIAFSGGLYINEGTWAGAANNTAAAFGAGTVYLGDVTPGSTKNATLAYRSSNGNNNGSGGISTNNLVVRAGSSGSLAFVVSNNFAGAITNGLSGTVLLNNNLTLAALSSTGQTNNLSGVVSGTGGLKIGDSLTTNIGIVGLSAINPFFGNTTVNSGTLSLGNVNALLNSTLDMGAVGTQGVAFGVAGTNTYNLGGLQGAQNLSLDVNTISVGANLVNTTYSGGVLSSTGGGLTKVGNGSLTLTGSNTYNGNTTVSGGTLQLAGSGSLALLNSYSGNIALNAATFNDNSSANQNLAGFISGGGNLVQSGPGTLTISAANTYTGGTTINGGVLQANIDNALGSNNLTMSGGTLDLADNSVPVKALNGTGVIGNSTAGLAFPGTLTVSNGGTFAGTIQDGVGGGASHTVLLVTGGALTLQGANTYSGSTSVNGAKLTAGAVNTLSPNSDMYLGTTTAGTLDVSPFNGQHVNSITVGANGTLIVSTSNSSSPLASVGAASFLSGSTLNIKIDGAITTPDILLTYSSSSALPFSTVNYLGGSLPGGDTLTYSSTSVEITSAAGNDTVIAASTASISLGRMLLGSLNTQTVTIGVASGSNSTGYTITGTGGATPTSFSSANGVLQGSTSATFSASIANTPGQVSGGSLSIQNTGNDGTGASGASGTGNTQPAIVIGVTGTVVTDRSPNFSVDLGSIGVQHAGSLSLSGQTLNFTSAGSHTLFTDVSIGGTTYNGTVTGGTLGGQSASIAAVASSGTASISVAPSNAETNFSYSPATLTSATYTATVFSGSAVWNGTGTTWDSGASSSWVGGAAPGTFANFANSDTATFSGLGTTTTADLTSANPSLKVLSFSTSNYTLTGGSLQLKSSSGPAIVSFTSGTQSIASAVRFASNVEFDSGASGSQLTIASNINEVTAGQSLTLTGSGTLILSGTDNFTGGTVVRGGTLMLTSVGALTDGTSLTVGDPSMFAPVIPAAVAPSASPSITAVPEPGTLMLLAVAGVAALLSRKRR